jgi:hypothetical protein
VLSIGKSNPAAKQIKVDFRTSEPIPSLSRIDFADATSPDAPSQN